MADLQWFNPSEHTEQPVATFEPLPNGDYQVAITESVMEPTKKGDGKKLSLTLEVLAGPHKGRKVWESLNVENPSPKAQEIGRAMLSTICRACNVGTPRDSADLHNKPLMAKIIIDEYQNASGERKVRNKVTGFYPSSHAVKPQPKPAPKQPAGPPEPKDDDIPF